MGAIQNSINSVLDASANATKAITEKAEHDAQMKAGILQAIPEAATETFNSTLGLREVNKEHDTNIKNAVNDETKLQEKLAGMEVESKNPDISPKDKGKKVSKLMKSGKTQDFIGLRATEAAYLANEHLQDEYTKRAAILSKSALRLQDLTNLAERTNRTSMSPISDENIHNWKNAVARGTKEIKTAEENLRIDEMSAVIAGIGGKKN